VLLYVSLKYAAHAGLLSPDVTEDIGRASERRIVVYQLLYAGACLLCVVNTYLAITVLVLLQLNSVIVPPIPLLNRF